MKYTPKQYAQALFEALQASKPADHEKVIDNFAAILKLNNDLEKFSQIEASFHEYERESKGIKSAQVATARELSKGEEEKIIKQLNEYIGGQLELETKTDQELIGGIVVRIDDEQIDGSIRRNLTELKNYLTQT